MTTIILTGAVCFLVGWLISASWTRHTVEYDDFDAINEILPMRPLHHCNQCCYCSNYRCVHLTETELQMRIERAYCEGRNADMLANTPLNWHNKKEILESLKPAKKSMEELLKELQK